MRLVFGLVLVLGMGLAGFAVFMAKDYINAYQTELATERAARAKMVPTVDVYVSTRSLRYGERLHPEDVRIVKWPENAIPEGAFQKKEVLFSQGAEDENLRTVIRAMEKDEAIMAIKVTAPGEDAGVSSRLAKGMRAFAIKVDVASGVSGFLRPGDKVDVYWTGANYDPNGENRGSELTKLIETNVKLLAVDQIADEDRNNPTIARTVTVEATPLQVAGLAQAQATGRLALSLVGAEDTDEIENVEVDARILLGREERQVVQVQRDRVCTVRTRKGAEIIETPIACAE
jgi:pilus assembly protein CpaB